MQKMSFRQVRDIQEAVRLLSKGVFINAKPHMVTTFLALQVEDVETDSKNLRMG